jgi:hypothetical protein
VAVVEEEGAVAAVATKAYGAVAGITAYLASVFIPLTHFRNSSGQSAATPPLFGR